MGWTSLYAVCGGGAVLLLGTAATLGALQAEASTLQRAILAIVEVSLVVSAATAVFRFVRARRRERQAQAKVDADLAGGVAAVERLRATDAVRAILPKRERAYFLRLED